jgi:hypothetical protein
MVERFLPTFESFVLDVDAPDAESPEHGRFVLGSGAALPVPSGALDAVIALDTLEHVPIALRRPFLEELARAAPVVVVSAPFASDEVRLAESALGEFVTQRFGGFATLEEHSEHGLPDLDESVACLARDGWAVATLPSGFLPRWLAGMLLHHELLASGVEELSELHAYYNATVSPLDCREPSYRHVIVAAQGVAAEQLDAVVDTHRSAGDRGDATALLGSIVSAVFAQRLGGVLRSGERAQLELELANAREQIAGLQRVIVDREAHLFDARNEQRRLLDENEALRRTMTNRVVGKIKRVVGATHE